jgi:hypothetical protein
LRAVIDFDEIVRGFEVCGYLVGAGAFATKNLREFLERFVIN